jgi:hypothetical protein
MGPILAIGLAFGGGAATVTVSGIAVTSVSSAITAVATTAAVGGLVAATNAAMKKSDSDSDIDDYKRNYKKPTTTTATFMNNNNNNNNDIQKKIKDIIDEQCVDKVYDGIKKVTPEEHKKKVDGISNIHSAIDLLRHPTDYKVAKGICEIGHHFEH